MQRHIDSLAKQVEFLRSKEETRHKAAEDSFTSAMKSMSEGGSVVIMTSDGHMVRALVGEVKVETAMIDVGNGFLPGLKDVSLVLYPQPGGAL